MMSILMIDLKTGGILTEMQRPIYIIKEKE